MAAASSSAAPAAARVALAAGHRTAPSIDDWAPPEGVLAKTRSRDFVRFTELQAMLKSRCAMLLHFVRRDFGALAEALPEAAGLCAGLGRLEPGRLTENVGKFAKSLEALLQRISEREKLRIVFIGPVNAGKTTLINMLLTAALGDCESVLPTSPQAETNCIWKVASCDRREASVLLDDRVLKIWRPEERDAVSMARTRAEIADFLDSNLSREAQDASQTHEVSVFLPLEMLNPFGCHYCLVDTPGYTESDEYEALVAKYLRDHSHIACMVCNLNQGKAVVQSTRNMMARSYSRTFWVLTQYDELMSKRKRGQDPRQVADKAVQAFRNEICEVDAAAHVFTHAAQMLMAEEEGWNDPLRQHLPREEAVGWLAAVQSHLKGCFLEIQQRNHVLSSQSRHCMEAASDILNEYANLRDGSSGALAANEYYVREMQSSAEEVANDMEREIQREVEAVKNLQLEHLCGQAAQAVRARESWTFSGQQAYYQAISEELAPMIQRELQLRLDAAVNTAHTRILATAQRLLSEAGLVGENGQVTGQARDTVTAPTSDHLRARYPVESFMAFSLAASAAGTAAVTETGAALLAGLGLRLGAASVAGLVGVAVVSFATLGYTAKKAAEINPCWTYAAAETDVIARIRQATQWGMLAEASASRARAQLLSGVAQFRYSFSVVLLHRGTPRSVLESLFPDLPLFEVVHGSMQRSCIDVRAFADAPDLAGDARAQLDHCRQCTRVAAWPQVVDATCPYVEPNARTDSVDGEVLASILHLRCHALLMADMFGEARESAEVFRRAFPELVLPALYRTAAHLRFEYLSGSLDEEAARAEVRSCVQRLEAQHAAREVPREIEVWFWALVVSWVEFEDAREGLLRSARCLLAQEMKERPSLERICDRVAATMRSRFTAVHQELSQDVLEFIRSLGRGGVENLSPPEQHAEDAHTAYNEVREAYQRECAVYATGVVNSVHLLLSSLPPSHLDMASIGQPLAEGLLAEISEQLVRPPAADPSLERAIHSELCPVDAGHVPGLCEEWVRVLGAALRYRF